MTVLSSVNGATLRPVLAVLLTIIGLRILVRFARPAGAKERRAQSRRRSESDSAVRPARREARRAPGWCDQRHDRRLGSGRDTLSLAPRCSPALRDRLRQYGRSRRGLGVGVLADRVHGKRRASNVAVVVAMLLGGVIAAPVAAWLIRFVPPRPMGVAVAGLLLLTNARELAAWGGLGFRAMGLGDLRGHHRCGSTRSLRFARAGARCSVLPIP